MNRREWLFNGGLALASVLVSGLIAEAGLRYAAPWDLFADRRTDEFWVEVARRSGRSGDTQGSDVVADERLGWRMRPQLTRNGVRHNSLGFRGATEPAPGGRSTRILAIGDSFTYGLGVSDEETYASQLAMLANAEVINAGVNAYGIDQALLMWEYEGRRFRPDVVVLGYYVDDFFRNRLAVRDQPKPRFALDPESRRFELRSVADSRRYADELGRRTGGLERWRVYQAATWVWRKLRIKAGAVDDEVMLNGSRLSNFLLDRLNQSVTQSGARLVVVYFSDEHGGPQYDWIEASVADSCRSLAIECINMGLAMRRDVGSFYGPNHHLSPLGHRFTAEQIARALRPTP